MTPSLAAVPDKVAADRTRSLQGEQQDRRFLYADRGFVSGYVRRVSDGILTCRQRYRHRYPPLSRTKIHFDGITPTGYLTRRSSPCLDCGCAIQVELFESFVERGEVRVEWHASRIEYIENELGETYPTQGHGMVRPRDVKSEIVTMAIIGHDDVMAMVAAAQKTRSKWKKAHPAPKG